MATVTMLGLADHGRLISDDEFDAAEREPGYKYELIGGRVYVSPEAELPEFFLEKWLTRKLERCASRRPDVIDFVANKARVFLRSEEESTVPEPDIAAYRRFPRRQPLDGLRWKQLSPVLVAEILVESDPFKDLIRNVELYKNVPTIREYWILDGRGLAEKPVLTVYRRRGRKWLPKRDIPFGQTYTTRLLPGFKLLIDPRR